MAAERPMSLYLVVPPSDISCTRPLVRLILNQTARRLTETLPDSRAAVRPRLLLMLDEFPALGRLDFFETSLAFMAGYGVRAFLVAQSLNQIDRAYGVNHAILDNCHVRVAFAPNDERTARRLSEALGTATEIRRHKNVSGSRLSIWLPHLTMSEQETPRPLLTPGEVLQLPADEALVLVSGAPPIRANKLQYYADRNFLARCLAAPPLSEGRRGHARADDWSGRTRLPDPRIEKAWFDLVAPASAADERPPRTREIAPRRSRQKDRAPPDLPLFAWEPAAPGAEEQEQPAGEELENVVQFPGLRL
jgi:type IV secretion system protein VirD4